jgi:hypothetical protein
MGQRAWIEFEEKYPYLGCSARWSGAGMGRFWKRQLSKSRRRNAQSKIRYELGIDSRLREQIGYERECNWKLW